MLIIFTYLVLHKNNVFPATRVGHFFFFFWDKVILIVLNALHFLFPNIYSFLNPGIKYTNPWTKPKKMATSTSILSVRPNPDVLEICIFIYYKDNIKHGVIKLFALQLLMVKLKSVSRVHILVYSFTISFSKCPFERYSLFSFVKQKDK